MAAAAEFPPPAESEHRVHLVGIKGQGMTALAQLLRDRNVTVSGSDVAEHFYTDDILRSLGIVPGVDFVGERVHGASFVVYSDAYLPEENPELIEAQTRGIPRLSYAQALGALSRRHRAAAVAGVHGKTTTTAMAGVLAEAVGLPASVVVGGQVPDLGNRAAATFGDRYLIAETDEYRSHFLDFDPAHAIITTVELEHTDFYPDAATIHAAFVAFARRLRPDGCLIVCRDDPGAWAVAQEVVAGRPDIQLIPYGSQAQGAYQIQALAARGGGTAFSIPSLGPVSLRVPLAHNAANATAAVALVQQLMREEGLPDGVVQRQQLVAALARFRGSRRRSEVVGEAGGVLFIEDYAHHPTEVRSTLQGLRAFYPGRRLVVDFMPHLYSRTSALLPQFATSFGAADQVFLHDIYASRERNTSGINGADLARAVSAHHPQVTYFPELSQAQAPVSRQLRPGDVFVSMGAGDNWKLGEAIRHHLGGKQNA